MLDIAGNPALDPTLPGVSIELGGVTYNLVFTFAALALAESKLRAAGIKANLLQSLDLTVIGASSIIPLLYAAMITDKPDIAPAQVAALVTLRNWGSIYDVIVKAYVASLADPDKDADVDPPQPES